MSVEARVVIDDGILESYRALQDEGQPDVVTEFIDIFLEDLPLRLERLREVVATTDVLGIKSAAHSLKGSASSVGAVLVSGYASQLEANARANSADGSHELLAAIETEAARATVELRKHRRP